jgi:hypothetical protein
MPGSSLGPQEYPHTPAHVFSAHFVLTHVHPRRTFWSVTHRSKPSTVNFRVFLRWASGKEVATCWQEYSIYPIKPWSRMHTHPLRRSTSSLINPQPGTFSLYHVCVSSVSACAMLCDHSGPTSAMRTMPVQLLPTWAP